MAKKLNMTVIAATVAASLTFTSIAEAGGRGLALGVGLGVLAVGAMAHQAQQAKQAKMARARAQAQAQARAKAQAQARAKAKAQAAAAARQKQVAAAAVAKAEAAKADAAEETQDEVAEKTTNTGPSTYVAAPSSTAALTQADVNAANPAGATEASTVAAVDTPAAHDDTADEPAPNTCKRYVPALGVPVDVDC